MRVQPIVWSLRRILKWHITAVKVRSGIVTGWKLDQPRRDTCANPVVSLSDSARAAKVVPKSFTLPRSPRVLFPKRNLAAAPSASWYYWQPPRQICVRKAVSSFAPWDRLRTNASNRDWLIHKRAQERKALCIELTYTLLSYRHVEQRLSNPTPQHHREPAPILATIAKT